MWLLDLIGLFIFILNVMGNIILNFEDGYHFLCNLVQ